MKILFVVTAFYPEQAIGSVRITKFAKFLDRAGHAVTVLSLAPAPWAGRDESLWFPGLKTIRWTVVPQSKIFSRFFMRARAAAVGNRPAVHVMDREQKGRLAAVSGWVKSKAQFGYSLLKALDWMIQVRRTARNELQDERFDVIFTSYPSFASPFSGLMLKQMGLGDEVLIDFRDPISYGTTSKRGLSRRLERWLGDRASATSYASKGVRAKVESAFSRNAPRRGRVVTNGFDSDDRATLGAIDNKPIRPEVMSFAYVGSLYGGKRDLSGFFMVLSEVIRGAESSSLPVELHYAGQEGDVFLSQARVHGLGDLVIDHGRVSRQESLRLQQESDICLLVTWNTTADQGVLPGKIFEFFLMRKPVLAIVNGDVPGSEVGSIIDEVNAGFCFEEADPLGLSALTNWLASAIREKRESGSLNHSYSAAIENYSIEVLALDLFHGLDDPVASKGRG